MFAASPVSRYCVSGVAWRVRKLCAFLHTTFMRSPKSSHIRTATDAVVRDADRNLLRQRIGETAMVVEASDGKVVVSPKCGTLQGDSIAGDIFAEGYHSILDAWNARLRRLGPPFRITAFSPFDLSDQDMAVTTYADDVCRKILISPPRTASVLVQQSNAILDEELSKASMAQNVDKQQHITVFKGTDSRKHAKHVSQHGIQAGTAVFEARYLGGLQRFDGPCGPEIDKRAKAAYVSWCTFQGSWHRRELPRRGLTSVFLGMVYEVLLAGLDALVLGRRQYDQLDRIITAYGRRLMRGTACEKAEDEQGQIHYRSVLNSAVFRFLGIASSRIELRIRRLKFLQRQARDPRKHHQVITAIFGTMFFEGEPTIQPDGGLSTYANSYAKTYWEDIQALRSLDSAYWLVDMADGEVMPFFSELAEEFVHVDVSELRAQELSVCIPPPGYLHDPTPEPEAVDERMHWHTHAILYLTMDKCVASSLNVYVIYGYTSSRANSATTACWTIPTKLHMSTNALGVSWFMPRLCPRGSTLNTGCPREHALQAPVVGVSLLPSRTSLTIWNADFVNMNVLTCRSCLRILGRISDSFTVGVPRPRLGGMETWTAHRRQANDNGNQPPTKMRALSTGEDAETVRKALLLVSKMTLRQELEIRELQSAVFKTFVVREPNPTISAVKAEVGSYLEKAKVARSSGGSLPDGEVHAYAWAALTQVAVQQKALDGTSKAVLDSHRAAMTSPDMIADLVYIAKLKKAFNKGEFKLFLAVSPAHHSLLEVVSAGVLATGAVEKKGQAAASGMSRELPALVDKLTEIASK